MQTSYYQNLSNVIRHDYGVKEVIDSLHQSWISTSSTFPHNTFFQMFDILSNIRGIQCYHCYFQCMKKPWIFLKPMTAFIIYILKTFTFLVMHLLSIESYLVLGNYSIEKVQARWKSLPSCWLSLLSVRAGFL